MPKEGIFLISTAVVQADSRFQYAKAARPFALCAPPPDPLKGVLPAKSKHITRSEHGFVTYRAEICEGRREPLSGRASLGFVSLVSCKTHLARLCQERPPDGGHRLRQQTSGGDPSFSGGYHRLFPQKEMGVHIPRRPKGRLPPFFPRKEPGVHIPRRHKRPPSAFRRKRGRGYISPYEAPLLALL